MDGLSTAADVVASMARSSRSDTGANTLEVLSPSKYAAMPAFGHVDMPTAWWPWNTHDNNTTCVLCSCVPALCPRESQSRGGGGGAHMVPLQCSLCSVPVVRLEAYAW